VEGSALGGVGPGVSPAAALSLGLKVDVDALPKGLQKDLKNGHVDLNDPANTLALLKANAVIGVKGIFDGDSLKSIGLSCSLCHTTSMTHSLRVSAIVSMAGPIGSQSRSNRRGRS
jgi:hypothetical protein